MLRAEQHARGGAGRRCNYLEKTLISCRCVLLYPWRTPPSTSPTADSSFNDKAKPTLGKSYGFPGHGAIEFVSYHHLGALSEPPVTLVPLTNHFISPAAFTVRAR
jgi:hypothetical protein